MKDHVEASSCCGRPIITATMLGRLLHSGCARGGRDHVWPARRHEFEECDKYEPLLRNAQEHLDRWQKASREEAS